MTLRSGVLAPRRPSRVFASFRGLEELEHVSRGRQILSLGALLLALPAGAVTKTWQGANNGEWGTAGNWTPNGVPSNADDVVINVARTIRLSAGIAAVAASVSIGAGATLNDRNSGSTLTVGWADLGDAQRGRDTRHPIHRRESDQERVGNLLSPALTP